jgi:hypothetical protein
MVADKLSEELFHKEKTDIKAAAGEGTIFEFPWGHQKTPP